MTSKEENQFIKDTLPLIHSIVNKLRIAGPGRQDAVQEACMAAIQAVRSYDTASTSSLSTWIHNNISWRLCNWMDSETLRRSGEAFDPSDQGGNDSKDWAPRETEYEEEGVAHNLDTGVDLRQVLALLPAEQLDLVEGFRKGEDQAMMAKRLGISPKAVERRVAALRKAIRSSN